MIPRPPLHAAIVGFFPHLLLLTLLSLAGRDAASDTASNSTLVSADGRYAVFWSAASNLVNGDSNGAADVFRHDVKRGEARLLSANEAGAPGNGASRHPSLSADGRWVAFESEATDLVSGDGNGVSDIFLHDGRTHRTRRVSLSSSGGEANGRSYGATLSGNGRFLAFVSEASNLVEGDGNGAADVFLHDTRTGHSRRISVASSGSEAGGASGSPAISADGRWVAFVSAAANLADDDRNGSADVFVHDRKTGRTRRVSLGGAGEANGYSDSPAISAGGRWVAFASSATNLVESDGNDRPDVFLRDLRNGKTRRISLAGDGTEAAGASFRPSLSRSGRHLAFLSDAPNLVPGDKNGHADVFVYDRKTSHIRRVSVASGGGEGDGDSFDPSLSPSGRHAVFGSLAANLVEHDGNDSADLFLHDGRTRTTRRLSLGQDRTESEAAAYGRAHLPLPAPPVADFGANPSRGGIPLDVGFTDRSGGEISNRLWDFGDGQTSTEAAPAHRYAAAGSYTVSLLVTGPGGSATRTRAGYIVASSGPAPPEPPSSGLTTVRLSAGSGGSAPFVFGQAFKRGAVPAGQTLAGVQLTIKNTWPDGSAKLGIVAGVATVAAGTPRPVGLQLGQPPQGTALTTADLRATAITASVEAGGLGSASWSGADWDAPFRSWVGGPLMSSWIYRKPVAGDAHLVAWLEVRLWSTGAVEVLPWIENGYLDVAGATSKSATYGFLLGGTERFSAAIDLKHHQRTPLLSGTALSHWLAGDPGLTIRHDPAYLMATELVPTYRARVGADSSRLAALPTGFAPLQQGSFDYDGDDMRSTGYQTAIGLLPEHDVLYLTADAAEAERTYGAVVRNGYGAGRYGIHYRDEASNRPLRFSAHPTLTIREGQGFHDAGGSTTSSYTPQAGGGNPPIWDCAHSPSVGYLAYLITGRWYFLEETQFAATANYLGKSDNAAMRDGSKGLVQTAVQAWQTRAAAWQWRSLAQALTATPDDDELRGEYIASAEANIDHYHGRYVAQPHNGWGLILPGETYDNSLDRVAFWQQDFVTAAFGYSLAMDLPVSSTAKARLAEFFAWKSQSAVKRLGTSSGWWYVNAVPYNGIVSSGASEASYAGGSGNWLGEAAAYGATYTPPPAWLGSTEGSLAGEIMPGERSYWGNLTTALAYAVRFGVPGALEGYRRIAEASNWTALRNAFDVHPVWSVAPASGEYPAWRSGAALNEWIAIPGTEGAGGAAIDPWGAFAVDHSDSALYIAASGGHADSADNRVVRLKLEADAPAWEVLQAPSAGVVANAAYYTDPDGPGSRHLYHAIEVVPQLGGAGKIVLVGARARYSDAGDNYTVDSFDLATGHWDPAGTWPDTLSGRFGAVQDRRNGNIWTSGLALWNRATGAVTQAVDDRIGMRWPLAFDSRRARIFGLQWGDGQGYGTPGVRAGLIDPDSGTQTPIGFQPSAAYDQFQADEPAYAAMDYDAENDRFLFFVGAEFDQTTQVALAMNRIYVITPNGSATWDMSLLPMGPGSLTPTGVPDAGSGINGRFRYVPRLRGFAMLPRAEAPVSFLPVR